MIGKLARGAYMLVVATMFVAWVVDFNKEVPAAPKPAPQVWYIHS